MSEQVMLDAIAESLQQAERRIAMVTGYTILAEYIDEDGDPCWYLGHPDDQRLSITLGQVELLRAVVRKAVDEHLGDDDE
jgi:hypothetical protein